MGLREDTRSHQLQRFILKKNVFSPLLFIFISLSASSPPTLSHYLSSHPHYCSAYLPVLSCHKVHHKKTMSARLDCVSPHLPRPLFHQPRAPAPSFYAPLIFSRPRYDSLPCHKTQSDMLSTTRAAFAIPLWDGKRARDGEKEKVVKKGKLTAALKTAAEKNCFPGPFLGLQGAKTLKLIERPLF